MNPFEKFADNPFKAFASDVPEGMFLNPQTGQYTSRELLRNNARTGPLRAAGMGYMQGYSYSGADELAGAGQSPEDSTFNTEYIRANDEALSQSNPLAYTTGKVAGAVLSPITKLFPAVKTIKGAAAAGGVGAAAEGYMRSDPGERVQGAAQDALPGMFFGGAVATLGQGVNKGVRALVQRSEERPSIETLRAAKNAAYAEVRKSGVKFDANETLAGFRRLNRLSQTSRWDLDAASDIDKAALDALRVMERRATKGEVTLNNLDKTRQKLWDIYNSSDHPFVLEAIGEIDGMIAAKAAGNEVMQTARLANSRFAKAQLLENAFKKARLQTAATGSGGNILNKYRQAVVSILNKPHERKWFSEAEVQLMESFVEGDTAENALRRIGKLSPGGNGLMTALNVYAASVDPSMLAVTGAATAAKAAADQSAMKGSADILKAVSTGKIPTPPATLPMREIGIGSGIGLPDAIRNRNDMR